LIGLDLLGIARLLFENFQNPQNKPTVNNGSDGRLQCNDVAQLEDLEQAVRVVLGKAIANAKRPDTIEKLNWPGSLVWERTKCGKKGCKCALGGLNMHGPYFYVITDRGHQSDHIPKGRAP
jgi:hypothetical protein